MLAMKLFLSDFFTPVSFTSYSAGCFATDPACPCHSMVVKHPPIIGANGLISSLFGARRQAMARFGTPGILL